MEFFILYLVVALVVFIILKGLVQIPANPPSKAVVTAYGRRTDRVINEGWHWILPFIEDVIVINFEKRNMERDYPVRTRDLAKLLVTVSITYTPSNSNLVNFLNYGGDKGVQSNLNNIIGQEVREFYAISEYGPKAGAEAIHVPIARLAKVITESHELNEGTIKDLEMSNANYEMDRLGIELNRVNVPMIKFEGRLEETADMAVGEEQKIRALRVVMNIIDELKKRGLSHEQATDFVQIERGKFPKNMTEHQLSLAPDTLKALENISKETLQELLELIKKNNKQ